MSRSEDLLLFVTLVEAGSFTAAAHVLNVSRSLLSKRLKHIEQRLGVRLLNRSTRSLSLTEAGTLYYQHGLQLRETLDAAESALVGTGGQVNGLLRIAASVPFGEQYLAPQIARFLRQHPKVQIDLNLEQRFVDLIDEGLDLAVRIGQLSDSNLVARRIGSTQVITCAATSYLAEYGPPQQPNDLRQHACLTYRHRQQRSDCWLFRQGGTEQVVQVSGPLCADSGHALCQAALAGLGVINQPDFIVAPYLRSGQLQEVLSGYRSSELGIYLVYPSRRQIPAKTQAFIEFLQQQQWSF